MTGAPVAEDLGETDLFVIGGGVNGAGIARDAAGRGLSVILSEKGDLAEGTSSRSGKLIHGGLRYLEYFEFRLVREALIEREVLLKSAPHLIFPMRFVLPQGSGDRPRWLVRLGLFLYDTLGRRQRLPGTRTLDLRRVPEGAPLKQTCASPTSTPTAGSTTPGWSCSPPSTPPNGVRASSPAARASRPGARPGAGS